MTFQEIILNLQQFWADYGCTITQPYDIEVGAGTFNPSISFGNSEIDSIATLGFQNIK